MPDKWQPIKTAPKDKTVLITDGDGVTMAFWNRQDKKWDNDLYEHWEPTHWMPLPEPPEPGT